MKNTLLILPLIGSLGCAGLPVFKVAVDSEPVGARIDVNGDYIGRTPVIYSVTGNADRSFNGAWVQGGDVVFTASPDYGQTNLYPQKKSFAPSAFFKQGDHIPEHIFFDMHAGPADASNPQQLRINIDQK